MMLSATVKTGWHEVLMHHADLVRHGVFRIANVNDLVVMSSGRCPA